MQSGWLGIWRGGLNSTRRTERHASRQGRALRAGLEAVSTPLWVPRLWVFLDPAVWSRACSWHVWPTYLLAKQQAPRVLCGPQMPGMPLGSFSLPSGREKRWLECRTEPDVRATVNGLRSSRERWRGPVILETALDSEPPTTSPLAG